MNISNLVETNASNLNFFDAVFREILDEALLAVETACSLVVLQDPQSYARVLHMPRQSDEGTIDQCPACTLAPKCRINIQAPDLASGCLCIAVSAVAVPNPANDFALEPSDKELFTVSLPRISFQPLPPKCLASLDLQRVQVARWDHICIRCLPSSDVNSAHFQIIVAREIGRLHGESYGLHACGQCDYT